MVFTIFSQYSEVTYIPEVSTLRPQLAAIPQGFPREGKRGENTLPSFDPRFARIDPLTAFQIPRAVSFSSPMGGHMGAFTYNAQPYWEENPHRRGHHTGDDLNGIGGMNSDLGDSVYAIADGLVVFSGEPSPGWGNVVVLAHRIQTDGKEQIIQSLYAHLKKRLVQVDEMVSRGEEIGTVGSANGQYLAHLHFEIKKGLSLNIGPGYLRTPRTHLSPEEFLQGFLENEDIFITPLSSQPKADWQDLEMNNAEHLLEVLDR